MKDKKPLVLQEEYGKDEDGTQVNELQNLYNTCMVYMQASLDVSISLVCILCYQDYIINVLLMLLSNYTLKLWMY